MTFETRRAIKNARPFRPCEIRTGPGEAEMVTHPEITAVELDGDMVVVLPGAGRIGIIDIRNITEVIAFPSARKVGVDDAPDITA